MKPQISEETRKAIQNYLNLNEKFKNSFFWSPPAGSYSRRKYEKENTFQYEGEGIYLHFIVECSCKNIYIRRYVKINGIAKTAAALKKYVS